MLINSAAEAWLTDLETTESPQITGWLHTDLGFCCLGRAYVANGFEPSKEHITRLNCADNNYPRTYGKTTDVLQILGIKGVTSSLDDDMIKMLGLKPDCGGEVRFASDLAIGINAMEHTLVYLNDSKKWTFKQIAAFIRANLEHFFIPLEEQQL